MSDNTINLVSESERNNSSAMGMGTSLDSHLPPLSHDHMGQEVISLFDNSNSKRAYGNTFVYGVSSFDSFEALLSDDGERECPIEVPIPSPILTEEKTQVNKLMREHVDDFT